VVDGADDEGLCRKFPEWTGWAEEDALVQLANE
jgi:hypothetical protein